MRQRCIPSKDTVRWNQLGKRPPDPAHAPSRALERARAALKAFDPFLDLWWSPAVRLGSPQPGRWTVKEWLASSGAWDTVLIWEGPNGEYRDEFPTDVLIAQVAARSLQGASLQDHMAKAEAASAARIEARDGTKEREGWREANHKAAYDSGARFGVSATDHRNAKVRHSARKVIARERQRVPG